MSTRPRYGDVFVWIDPHGDPMPKTKTMFVRWSIPSDQYNNPGYWVGVCLSDPSYRIDPGYPEPSDAGVSTWRRVE